MASYHYLPLERVVFGTPAAQATAEEVARIGARVPEDLERLRAPDLKEVTPSPVRQVAVPTTLSGAEFSNLGGGADVRTRIKHPFTRPDIGPRSVILDPSITPHTPEWLWRSTGIRGVDHEVEALCSVDAHLFCHNAARIPAFQARN